MSKQKARVNIAEAMRRRAAAICLSDRVNRRTYVHLVKYDMVKAKEEDIREVPQALRETASLCTVAGPFIFHRPDPEKKALAAIKLSNAILSCESEVRKAILDYLIKECATFMSLNTLAKIDGHKKTILSQSKNKWIPAAVKAFDAIEADWQFGYQGLLQVVRVPKFEDGIIDCLTKVLRPDTAALGAMDKGILAPSQIDGKIAAKIREIATNATSFDGALRQYYECYGHVPLGEDMSVCGLYTEWKRAKGLVDDIWAVFWKWVDSYTSPLPRYHACLFFANNPTLIPEDCRETLLKEVIAVACPTEDNQGKWHHPWAVRCLLARYYCEYIECRHPRESGERIASQAWWLANKVGDVYGDSPVAIKGLREGTVEPEETQMNIAWQMVHLPPEPSSLRYATMHLRNMWSLSLVAQLKPEALKVLFSIATEIQRKTIDAAIAGNLINLFPIRDAEAKVVYAFDRGCAETAREVIRLGYQDDAIGMIDAFVTGAEKIASEDGFKEAVKRLPQGNAADLVWTSHALHVLANADRAPKEFIWECLRDREWMKSVLGGLDMMCAERFCEGLRQIQLRTKGKWDEQLPHVFAVACEELPADKDKRALLFAFVILSSLAADSASAIDRLLRGKDKFDYQEFVEQWRNKIEYVLPLVPEWCRARLRAILASLHV